MMRDGESMPLASATPPLEDWLSAEREPVFYSDDPWEWAFLSTMWLGEPLEFYYDGGTSPGQFREAILKRASRVRGSSHLYLTGWCLLRGQERTFRLDRIQIPIY